MTWTANKIKTKINANQHWLERAILAIDNNGGWEEEHARFGQYLANYIRNVNDPGKSLSGRFVEQARKMIAEHYCKQLAVLAKLYQPQAVRDSIDLF